jgi:pimeloyl-ACP methyl ester carboxylesterase
LTRTKDHDAPVVWFLHGGPGAPTAPYSYAFDAPLLERFQVVHWDQRAAGRSAQTLPDAETLTIDQYVDDAAVVLAHLEERFADRRIVAVGHSWGTILARYLAHRRPSDIDHLVLVGTTVDFPRTQRMQEAFLKERAPNRWSELDVGSPPWSSLEDIAKVMSLLDRLGASLGRLSGRFHEIGAASPHYTEAQQKALTAGNLFTIEHLLPELARYRVPDGPERFEMPVTFIHGDRDMATPYALAREYYKRVEAPAGKSFHTLEGAAHFAMWERPERFASILAHQLSR